MLIATPPDPRRNFTLYSKPLHTSDCTAAVESPQPAQKLPVMDDPNSPPLAANQAAEAFGMVEAVEAAGAVETVGAVGGVEAAVREVRSVNHDEPHSQTEDLCIWAARLLELDEDQVGAWFGFRV